MKDQKAPKTGVKSATPANQKGPRASQMRGVPDCWSQTLFPCRVGVDPDGDGGLIINRAAIAVGVKLVDKVSIITYHPIMVARNARLSDVVMCIKVVDTEDDNVGEVLASLHMIYMDRDGKNQEIYSEPLNTKDGIQFNFSIPLAKIDVGEPLSLALKVSLCSLDEDDNYLPVLLRSAWVEAV